MGLLLESKGIAAGGVALRGESQLGLLELALQSNRSECSTKSPRNSKRIAFQLSQLVEGLTAIEIGLAVYYRRVLER